VYGTTVETYRRVAIADIATTVNARSALAVVTPKGTLPTDYSTVASSVDFTYAAAPTPGWTMINPPAFAPVFAANAPLDKVSIFNLMVLPGLTDPTALAEALSYCEAKRAFFIMDPPANAVADSLAVSLPGAPAGAATMESIWDGGTLPVSANGAIYFPYLQTTDLVTGAPATSPPSGFVAGIFAKEDNNRGVWKSPAGLETTILGTTGVVLWGRMTDPQQGVLNPLGVNCLRTFPGIGSVVFGARTLVSENPAYEQWRYVAVRRMALFLEQSLYGSLGWAIFEPNDIPLWNALTQEVQAFMLGLHRQGAFQGATADQAFHVQCDSTTTSQADIDNGIVNILVAFAPLKPAEFVVIQIAQLAGQTQS
jgi:phage tail sheath protein FI